MPGGVLKLLFDRVCCLRSETPIHSQISCFLREKNANIPSFFVFVSRLFVLFFAIFVIIGSSSKDFLSKLGPMSKIFGEKVLVTHLGSTSLYALTCEYSSMWLKNA